MDVTPQELRSSEIKEERRGYHRDQTDDLLERAAATIESLNNRLNRLTERMGEAESRVGQGRETEELLQRTLLLAQRTADEAVAEAKARAEQLVREAEERSTTMVREAETEARHLAENERRRVEAEVAELAAKRHALATDVDALERFEADYRERVRSAIAADLETLTSREPTTPPSRPTLHEIDVPEGPEGVVTASEAEPFGVAIGEPAQAEAGEEPDSAETVELGVFERAELGLAGSGDEEAGSGRAGSEAEEVPEAVPVDEPAGPEDEPTASGREPSGRGELFEQEADSESLDDDAFFASLREAVRDDAPLGPADEEGSSGALYDQDSSEEDARKFTDVFRRRR
jgi:cell division septum initiation protein DivIVA